MAAADLSPTATIGTTTFAECNIHDYETSVKSYFRLWRWSNGQIPVRPLRNKMRDSDKKITHIVLENGTMVPLAEAAQFHIYDRVVTDDDTSAFRISVIPDVNFESQLSLTKQRLYHSRYMDHRILAIQQIQYKQVVYSHLLRTFSHFLHHTDNIIIKKHFQHRLLYRYLPVQTLREFLFWTLKYILLVVCIHRDPVASEENSTSSVYEQIEYSTFPANDAESGAVIDLLQHDVVLSEVPDQIASTIVGLSRHPDESSRQLGTVQILPIAISGVWHHGRSRLALQFPCAQAVGPTYSDTNCEAPSSDKYRTSTNI